MKQSHAVDKYDNKIDLLFCLEILNGKMQKL